MPNEPNDGLAHRNAPVSSLQLQRQFTLIYSHRCDLACAHCCTWSGPSEGGYLTLPLARDVITSLRKLGITKVTIGGGEPMLFRDDLLQLIDWARQAELSVTTITNANWATSQTVATREIKTLATSGLKGLSVSIDRFHLAQMPLERALWVLRACRWVGLAYQVNLGELPDQDFDQVSFFQLMRQEGHTLSELQKPMLLGRGHQLKDAPSWGPVSRQPCGVACNITADSDGSVYPCCGAPGLWPAERDVLRVGNLNDDSADEIFSRIPGMVFQLLHTFGPIWLLEMLAYFAGTEPPVQTFKSICQACVAVFQKPWREVLYEFATSRPAWARLQCAAVMRRSARSAAKPMKGIQ